MFKFGLLMAAVLVLSLTFGAAMFTRTDVNSDFSLYWLKRGGVAGITEELAVYGNGSWSYKLTLGGRVVRESDGFVSREELNKLMDSLRESGVTLVGKDSYWAKPRAMDYFTYSLKLTLDDAYVNVNWVDEWASEKPVPDQILEAGKIVQEFIASHTVGDT